MTKNTKIILGILTFLPLILFIGYFVSIFSTIFSAIAQAESGADPDMNNFIGSIITAFGTIGLLALLSIGLMIYYVIHVMNNKYLDSNSRVIWALVIVLVGFIGNIVYWFVQIWPEKEEDDLMSF